ncbi:MAG: YCF48-related protein [Algoriphagus sp.]|nr:YCF48-related protein [Algoriphagus sp.]
MHKILGLFFLGMLASSTLLAQTWTRMQSWGLDFESVVWVDSNLGFAAGEKLLVRSKDGGNTWEELGSIPDVRFFDITFQDQNLGVAVGENGVILRTQNGGDTWTNILSGVTEDLYSIAFSKENHFVAIGENGRILRSTNGGINWTSQNSGVSLQLNDLNFFNPSVGFVAANEGKILKTLDGGITWILINTLSNQNLNGIIFSSELIGYAAGEGGLVTKTVDGGQNWTQLITGVTVSLKKISISPLDVRIIVAVGDGATSIRSANSGTAFAKANLGTGNLRNLKSISFKPTSNLAFATGQDGYLISSTNAGTSWTQRLAGIRNDFTVTDFKSNLFGFIGGQSGAMYVTSNGGVSLISRPIPEPIPIVSMDFWNTGFGYVSSQSGKIFRTGNTGTNWVPVPAQTSETITGFYLFAPSVAYLTGTNGYIARSFDSGGTWDSKIETNTKENLRDVTYFDFQTGFSIGDNGQISWTFGGNVWENLPKLTDENLIALSKTDSTTAIIVGNKGVILKSTDMAKTWKRIQIGETKNLNSVDFWDKNIGFIAGDGGLTLQTKDGGETWVKIPSGTTRNLTSISAGNSVAAFAVGDDGTLLNYTCITPAGLSQISGNGLSCFNLETYKINDQNLPGSEIVWRADGGEIISGQGTQEIQVLWSKSGRNGVYVSRENFCGNGETSFLEVLVAELPDTTQEIQGEGSACKAQPYVYTLPNVEGVTYKWETTGGKIISGQDSPSVTVEWEITGEQQLFAIPQNRCGQAEPVIKPVSVNAAPAKPGEIKGEAQVGLGENFYNITGEDGINYQWKIDNLGGRIIEGQGTSSVKVIWQQEGDFNLSVTPLNICNEGEARILKVNVNVITSLPELNPDGKSLKIYPNPGFGDLIIESEILWSWQGIILINALGQEFRSVEIQSGQREINLNQLPKGLVVLRFHNSKGFFYRKVVVK